MTEENFGVHLFLLLFGLFGDIEIYVSLKIRGLLKRRLSIWQPVSLNNGQIAC